VQSAIAQFQSRRNKRAYSPVCHQRFGVGKAYRPVPMPLDDVAYNLKLFLDLLYLVPPFARSIIPDQTTDFQVHRHIIPFLPCLLPRKLHGKHIFGHGADVRLNAAFSDLTAAFWESTIACRLILP